MVQISRDKVLNNFAERIRNAKSSGLTEIKMSVKELDDVNFVIYQIMAEKFNLLLDLKKEIEESKKKKEKEKIEPKIIEKPMIEEDEEEYIISGGHF